MLVKISKPRQNTLRREKGQLESKKKLARRFRSLKYKRSVVSVRAELYMLICTGAHKHQPEQLY